MDGAWNDMTAHRQKFEAFATDWIVRYPESMLRLKREHTYAVLGHAEYIIREEGIGGMQGRAALLGALYHDVGRFPQYAQWKTFSDAHSMNHGILGARTLRQTEFLCSEPCLVRKLVFAAVVLHNRHHLPDSLPESVQKVTSVVRDADKLDIMRIMAHYLNNPVPSGDVVLHVKDDPEGWSPQIVETVLAGGIPGYADLKYINDFRMLLGTWLRDLHFRAARAALVRSGYLERVLQGLPSREPFLSVCSSLYALKDQSIHGLS